MKKRTGLLVAIFAAAFLLSVVLVSAQQPEPPQGPKPQPQAGGPQPPRPPMDPFGDSMFPPELVMQHQRELALTDEQKTFMRGEINRTTTRFNELQWQLQDAMEALHETMKSNSVNEQLALSQLDKVLDSEREIKRAHMELAIRIKNKLTPDSVSAGADKEELGGVEDGGDDLGKLAFAVDKLSGVESAAEFEGVFHWWGSERTGAEGKKR